MVGLGPRLRADASGVLEQPPESDSFHLAIVRTEEVLYAILLLCRVSPRQRYQAFEAASADLAMLAQAWLGPELVLTLLSVAAGLLLPASLLQVRGSHSQESQP